MTHQGPGVVYWLQTFAFALACVAGGVSMGFFLPSPWGLFGILLATLGAGWAAARFWRRSSEDLGSLSVGWPLLLLCLVTLVHYPLLVALTAPFLSFGLLEGPPPMLPASTLGPAAGLGLILGIWNFIYLGRRPTGTPGRVRGVFVALGTVLRSLGYAVLAVVLSLALTDPNALMLGLGLEESLMPVGQMPALAESFQLVTSAQGTYQSLQIGLVLTLAGTLIELAAIATCWFLLPVGFRRWFWNLADSILLFSFVAVTLTLPIQPGEDTPSEISLPSIRLAVTAIFAARALSRLLPVGLDLLETFGFRALTAARMIRAKKSGFLTTIGALSILAVSFSSCTLTTTLSVMGGFRNDLKEKILGNNAHVVIDREHGTFEGWAPVLEAVGSIDEVVAATPYVQGEVMITSATNLGGAVLRGIDPETIGRVTDLPRNMRHGQLDYLSHPERLLRLRPSEMGAGLLSPLTETGRERGSLFDDLDDVLDGAEDDPPEAGAEAPDAGIADGSASPTAQDGPPDEARETDRIARDLDEFLVAEDETDDEEAPAGQDVLPGLIVGQELARTLRLHVGDEVNVVSPLGELGPTGPIPKSRPFRVAGIFYSGMYEFDMKMAYTTLEAAQAFLNVGSAVTGIEVKVEDTDRAELVARAVEQALGGRELRVRAWQEVNRNLFGALQLEKLAMFITLGIAILVASFCIVGTLSLMVQEKRREVGILKAMGATGQQIVAVFMTQGLMIGVLGATTGLGLGYLSCFFMEHFGIRLNPEVYYIDRLPVHIDLNEFLVTGAASVIVCLLATIYPAILGSRLTPLDALRSS